MAGRMGGWLRGGRDDVLMHGWKDGWKDGWIDL